jgi:NADH-quinone oxidoreductase subunit G
VIDVCPVGALTDKTFRFKSRVWFTKPVDAHRDCDKCCGKVVLWYKGDDVLRVTTRRNEWNEVTEYICNTCRFEKKRTSDWVIEGPRSIDPRSVISQNHYKKKVVPDYIYKVAATYKPIDEAPRQLPEGQKPVGLDMRTEPK